MKIENQDKIKKIISIILLIFWCMLIFYFSNQVGSLSENSSSRLINFFSNLFGINLYKFKYIKFIVRKLAHIFLYFVLSLLSINCFKRFKYQKYIIISFIFCLIYSSCDEFHQFFISERSAQITDIFIDCIGIFLGIFLYSLINKYLYYRTNKHSK